jgi:hypothetical protein
MTSPKPLIAVRPPPRPVDLEAFVSAHRDRRTLLLPSRTCGSLLHGGSFAPWGSSPGRPDSQAGRGAAATSRVQRNPGHPRYAPMIGLIVALSTY